jgi:hypothetical protein
LNVKSEEERVVYNKLNSTGTLIQRTTMEAPQAMMYYIGLDVHKKTISYCVKDASGQVHREGTIGANRNQLDCWVRTLPQPRIMAMEATIFTGWIYDHLLPHAEQVKVAYPRTPILWPQVLMLRAIAAAKKKNDRIDAGKIADCLRFDFLPECHMASRDSGSTPDAALSAPAGAPDGADEEPDLRALDGNGSEP